MRKALIINLNSVNYYNFLVLIFVNGKQIGTGAYFRYLSQVRKFMVDCKVESHSITFEEDYSWKENIWVFTKNPIFTKVL